MSWLERRFELLNSIDKRYPNRRALTDSGAIESLERLRAEQIKKGDHPILKEFAISSRPVPPFQEGYGVVMRFDDEVSPEPIGALQTGIQSKGIRIETDGTNSLTILVTAQPDKVTPDARQNYRRTHNGWVKIEDLIRYKDDEMRRRRIAEGMMEPLLPYTIDQKISLALEYANLAPDYRYGFGNSFSPGERLAADHLKLAI